MVNTYVIILSLCNTKILGLKRRQDHGLQGSRTARHLRLCCRNMTTCTSCMNLITLGTHRHAMKIFEASERLYFFYKLCVFSNDFKFPVRKLITPNKKLWLSIGTSISPSVSLSFKRSKLNCSQFDVLITNSKLFEVFQCFSTSFSAVVQYNSYGNDLAIYCLGFAFIYQYQVYQSMLNTCLLSDLLQLLL